MSCSLERLTKVRGSSRREAEGSCACGRRSIRPGWRRCVQGTSNSIINNRSQVHDRARTQCCNVNGGDCRIWISAPTARSSSRGGRWPPSAPDRNSRLRNRLVWIASNVRLHGLIGCDWPQQGDTLAPTAFSHAYSAHQLARNLKSRTQPRLPTDECRAAFTGCLLQSRTESSNLMTTSS